MIKRSIAYLSVVCGALSLVSFVQRYGNFEISAFLYDYIEFYRKISSAVILPILESISLPVPYFYLDLWPLSLIGASAYVVAISRPEWPDELEFLARVMKFLINRFIGRIVLSLLLGLSMFGLLVIVIAPLFVLVPVTWMDADTEFETQFMRRSMPYMGRHVLAIFAGTVFFFIVNAFAPSA